MALCSLALGIASVPAIAGNAPVCTGPAVELPPVCKVQLPSPTVSCAVPADVAGQLAQPQLYLAQRASDLFSWQTFVGLHWPASKTERGVPNPMLSLGAPEPTVWETWREAGEVFRHDADGKPLPPLGTIPARLRCNARRASAFCTVNPRWMTRLTISTSRPVPTARYR
ncbi:MAG: hypothetical protein M3436_19005 [Pseudomonadota bacterium]|nr:hypothetical protein [Pseudomonadota bacterium]